MKEQALVQTMLRRKLAEAQEKNPSYSLRAFAKRVGLNPGAVSGILNGKRSVSLKLATQIAQRLLLDPQERSEMLSAFPDKARRGKSDEVGSNYLELSAAQYRVIADWEHFAILSLMKTKGFRNESEWIAERLGITPTKAAAAVSRMLELGIVEEAEGRLRRAQSRFRSSDDIADISVRKSHGQTLELAKESLQKHSVAERDHTAMTMAIDPANLSRAKELIRKFQDDLAEILESGEAKEVYRFSTQLFPLSVVEKDRADEK